MKPSRKSVLAALLVAGASGAYGAYYEITGSPCLTASCEVARMRDQGAVLDAADLKARTAWGEVQQSLDARIQIAEQIAQAGQGARDAKDAGLRGEMDKQEFMISGIDPTLVSDITRPFVENLFELKNQRAALAQRYADATDPLNATIEKAMLLGHAGMLAHTSREAEAFAVASNQLGENGEVALNALVADTFLVSGQAQELARLLAQNTSTMAEVVTTYNAAVEQLATLRKTSSAALGAGRPVFAQVSGVQVNRMGKLAGELQQAAFTAPPVAPQPQTGDGMVVSRAQLEAERDIAGINARADAAKAEAHAIMEQGRAEHLGAAANAADATGNNSTT